MEIFFVSLTSVSALSPWPPPHLQREAPAMNEVFLGIHNWVTHVWRSGLLITIMWTPRPADTFQVIFIVIWFLFGFGSASNSWMTFIHFMFSVQALAIFSLFDLLQSQDRRISRSQKVILMTIVTTMMSLVLGKLPQIVPHIKQSRGGLITYCSSIAMGDCLSLFREVGVLITYGSMFTIVPQWVVQGGRGATMGDCFKAGEHQLCLPRVSLQFDMIMTML